MAKLVASVICASLSALSCVSSRIYVTDVVDYRELSYHQKVRYLATLYELNSVNRTNFFPRGTKVVHISFLESLPTQLITNKSNKEH